MKTIFFCSTLLIAALSAPSFGVPPEPVESTGIIEPAEIEPQETFEVDGATYVIPSPWKGNSIPAPSPASIAFSRIAAEHTREGSSIYIEREANEALNRLMEAAMEDGIHLVVDSGFRSYNYQMHIFTKLLKKGREYQDIIRYVAPPGYSQHALGTAVDFYPSNWEFASGPAYKWLQEHGAAFGFTETYPRINPDGYPWEAWHWNYSSKEETATVQNESNDNTAF